MLPEQQEGATIRCRAAVTVTPTSADSSFPPYSRAPARLGRHHWASDDVPLAAAESGDLAGHRMGGAAGAAAIPSHLAEAAPLPYREGWAAFQRRQAVDLGD